MLIFSHMQNTSIPYIFGLTNLCTNKRLELHRSKGYSFVQAFICVAKWWRMSHINVREYRRGNNNCSIQSNWQHRAQNTIYVGRHYTQTNTNNVNKTWSLHTINWRQRRTGHRFYAGISMTGSWHLFLFSPLKPCDIRLYPNNAA